VHVSGSSHSVPHCSGKEKKGVGAAIFRTSLGHQLLWNSSFLKLGLDEVPSYSFLHLGFSYSLQFHLMA